MATAALVAGMVTGCRGADAGAGEWRTAYARTELIAPGMPPTAPGVPPMPADFALQVVVLQPGTVSRPLPSIANAINEPAAPTTDRSASVAVPDDPPAPASPRPAPVPRRFEHYIYQPNGLFRWDTGERAWAGRFPGYFRRLNQTDAVELWTAVHAVAAFDDVLRRIGNLSREVPPPSGASYLLWWRAYGEERAVRIDSTPEGHPALPAAEELSAMLADMAWVEIAPALPPGIEAPDTMIE